MVSVELSVLGLSPSATYRARNLWTHTNEQATGSISANLSQHAVAMYRLSIAAP
jgi:hypothetical protein